MAKTSTTLNLEDDLIEAVDELQKELKLKSRSSAHERVIIEWRAFKQAFKLAQLGGYIALDNISIDNSNSSSEQEFEEELDEFEIASRQEISNSISDMED